MQTKLRDMAYSDQKIFETLRRLLADRRPGEHISQAQISQAADVPIATTVRALHRLQKAGQIEGEFTRGIGYSYKIPGARVGAYAGTTAGAD